jgi:hypothetical protein
MKQSPEDLQEWVESPCSREVLGVLRSKILDLTSDLVHKVTEHNDFLTERGRILGIEEVIKYIEGLK